MLIPEKKIYPSLDIMKFLMAVSILFSHTQNDYALDASPILHYILAISNFGVPFFFACSAFLFFTKILQLNKEEQRECYKHFSIRIGKMYLVWSIIYTLFRVLSWIIYGVDFSQILNFLHELIVYTSYPTLWFLPALWIGISIIYLLQNKISNRGILIITALLYVICSLGECYNEVLRTIPIINTLLSAYLDYFITFRNGVLMGTPFVACGYFVACNSGPISNKRKYLISALVFSFLFIIESIVIKKYTLSINTHCGLFLLPATFLIMQYLVCLDLPNKRFYMHLRNQSMLIYLSQRLVLTAIPSLSHSFEDFLIALNPYLTIILVAVLVLLITITIELLSKKYSKLKVLW